MILTKDGVLIISGEGNGTGQIRQEGMFLKEISGEARARVKTVIIENGVRSIGAYEFSDCVNLTEAVIPESVKEIGIGAFSGCRSLKELRIPSGVEGIGVDAFEDCVSLERIEMLQEAITPASFEGVTAMRKAEIKHAGSIGYMAFYGCSNLRSIEIPACTERIEYRAFGECRRLSEIYFTGDAPKLEPRVISPGWGMKRRPYAGEVFFGVTATAFYPKDNPTWTKEVRHQYGKGGRINWVHF